MPPLVQLLKIACTKSGYKRYTDIDLSQGNPPAELAWIPSEDIIMDG